MAFTESSQPPEANSLVSFLDTASKTINGLMDKPSKGNKRKVNHKKFIQKRLQQQTPSPKAAKLTKSKLAPHHHQPAALTGCASAAVPPFLHQDTWPLLPNSPKPNTSQCVEPDLDFLLQQLTSTAADMPSHQPSLTRPCSDSSMYPVTSFSHQPPTSTLETQVLIGEQPYGSPYTPSNSSVDDIFEDSAYSSPSSSVYSSPPNCAASNTTVPLAHDWSLPTTSVPTCVSAGTVCDWGMPTSIPGMIATQTPTSCMVSCSEWLSMTSSPTISSACPVTIDQGLPTVPQLWDPLAFSDYLPY